MSQYDGKRPTYVRQWYLRLRRMRDAIRDAKNKAEEAKKKNEEEGKEDKQKGSATGPKRSSIAMPKDAEKALIEADP